MWGETTPSNEMILFIQAIEYYITFPTKRRECEISQKTDSYLMHNLSPCSASSRHLRNAIWSLLCSKCVCVCEWAKEKYHFLRRHTHPWTQMKQESAMQGACCEEFFHVHFIMLRLTMVTSYALNSMVTSYALNSYLSFVKFHILFSL